jgi:hypothetical protein
VECPFCGDALIAGSVRVGGMMLYPSVCQIVWEPEAGVVATRQTVGVGRWRRQAGFCSNCGAVLVAPVAVEPPGYRKGWRRFFPGG